MAVKRLVIKRSPRPEEDEELMGGVDPSITRAIQPPVIMGTEPEPDYAPITPAVAAPVFQPEPPEPVFSPEPAEPAPLPPWANDPPDAFGQPADSFGPMRPPRTGPQPWQPTPPAPAPEPVRLPEPEPLPAPVQRQPEPTPTPAPEPERPRPAAPAATPAPPRAEAHPTPRPEAAAAPGPIDHSSRDAFVRSMLPYAKQAEASTGIPAEIMIAINLNEQGWQTPAPGNNLFGIKGVNPRTGASTGPVATWEDYGNGRVNIKDTFRAYSSPAESYEDFGNFLRDNPRYHKALEVLRRTGDGAAFIKEVHRAGYATDPQWSNKILNIARTIPTDGAPPPPVPGTAPYQGQMRPTLAEELADAQREGLVPQPVRPNSATFASPAERIAALGQGIAGIPGELAQIPGNLVAGAGRALDASGDAFAGAGESFGQVFNPDTTALERLGAVGGAVGGTLAGALQPINPEHYIGKMASDALAMTPLAPLAVPHTAPRVIRAANEALGFVTNLQTVGAGAASRLGQQLADIDPTGPWRAAASQLGERLPPVPEGNVRLFRGEGIKPGEEIIGWEPPEYSAARIFADMEKNKPEYTGRYFSTDRNVAESFADPYLNYVDVPEDVVRQYQRTDPASGELADVILPDEWAQQRKAVPPGLVQQAMQAATRWAEQTGMQLAGIDPVTGLRRSETLGMSIGAPPPGGADDAARLTPDTPAAVTAKRTKMGVPWKTVDPSHTGDGAPQMSGTLVGDNWFVFKVGDMARQSPSEPQYGVWDIQNNFVQRGFKKAGDAQAWAKDQAAARAAPTNAADAITDVPPADGPKFAIGDIVNPVDSQGNLLSPTPLRVTDIQELRGARYYQVEGSKTYFPEEQLEPVTTDAPVDAVPPVDPPLGGADDALPPGGGSGADMPPAGTAGDVPPASPGIEYGHAQTVRTSPNTTDALRESLESPILTYPNRRSTEALYERAKARVDADREAAYDEIMDAERHTDEDVAAGQIIERMLMLEGTPESIARATRLLGKMAETGLEAGRTAQAFSIWNRMTPEGQLLHAKKMVNAAEKSRGAKRTSKRLGDVAIDLEKKKATEKTRQSRQKAKWAKDDADEVADSIEEMADDADAVAGGRGSGGTGGSGAKGKSKTPREPKASKARRTAVEKAIIFFESEGRAPFPPGSPEADALTRMKKLAQETGWTMPHDVANDLQVWVAEAKQLKGEDRIQKLRDIVDIMATEYLPMLEQRSLDYRASQDLIKRTEQTLADVVQRGRLPRQIAPPASLESQILNEVKRVYDRLGEVMPEGVARLLNDTLDTIKGMDIGDPARLAEAQRLIRENIGQGVLGPLREMEAAAQQSGALIKKAEQFVNVLADAGRNPTLLNLTDEQVKGLATLKRNANRVGYLLSPARRQELANWLDGIKGFRKGSTEEAEAIREYITRLTTGDIADEIAAAVDDFETARDGLWRVERLTAWLGDLGRNPGKMQLLDEDAAAFAEIRRLANRMGFTLPGFDRTAFLDAVSAARQMPEGPAKVAKVKELGQQLRDHVLPGLRKQWAEGPHPRTEGQWAKWQESNLRYIIDREERVVQPRITREVDQAVQRVRRAVREQDIELPEAITQEMFARSEEVRLLPDGSPERWRKGAEFMAWTQELIPPTRWQQVLEMTGLPRVFLATADASALLRQGVMLAVGHPASFVSNIRPMVKAMFDGEVAAQIDAALHTRARAKQAEGAGLYLAPRGYDAKITHREEQFMSRLVGKVPLVGGIHRGSQDAYVTFLNKMRADIFDGIVTKWEKNGYQYTDKDLADIAQWANWATGRGDLGILERISPLLSAGLFSPRFTASRIQAPYAGVKAAYSLLGGAELTPGAAYSRAVALEVGKDWAAYMAGGLVFLAFLQANGAEIEMDPRSADFGKWRYGNIRGDIWGGEQQMARLAAQFITEERKTSSGNIDKADRWETVGRFLQSKLAPTPGAAVNFLRGEDFSGKDLYGQAPPDSLTSAISGMVQDATGMELPGLPAPVGGLSNQALRLMVPMIVQTMIEAYQQEGMDGMALAGVTSFFGQGVQSYETVRDAQNAEAVARFGVKYDAKDNKGRLELTQAERREVNESERVAASIEQYPSAVEEDPKQTARLASELYQARKEPMETDAAEAFSIRSGADLRRAVQSFKAARFESAQTTIQNELLAEARGERTDANLADMFGEKYWSTEVPEKNGELDFPALRAARAKVLDEARAQGIDPNYITGTGKGTFRGERFANPKVRATVEAYEQAMETLRPYFEIAEAVQRRVPAYAQIAARVEALPEGSPERRRMEQTPMYNAYERAVTNEKMRLRRTNPAIQQAGATWYEWQKPDPAPGSLPAVPKLPSLPVLPSLTSAR